MARTVEIVTTGTGTIPEGAESVSCYNAGAGTGYLASTEGEGRIPAGTSKNIAANRTTFGVLHYNGTGTTLIITVIYP